MICRITGRLVQVSEQAVAIEVGGLCYEALVPAAALPDLRRLLGNQVTLFTIQYVEGNPALGNLVPRLLAFPVESDREFFRELTRVKGISARRALRAMAVPVAQFAAAIENGDARFLARLPELGKRSAAQVIAQLQGHVRRFLGPSAVPRPVGELTEPQRLALEILVQWGDRRVDAQRWVAAAVEQHPGLNEPEQIVRAAYRVKHAAGPL